MGEAAEFQPAAVSLRSWLSLLYLITFGSLLAFTTYMWLLSVARPSVIATYAYVNPLVAVFLGAAIGGETLTADVGLATAMILGAVAMITLSRKSPAAEIAGAVSVSASPSDDASDVPKVRLAECDG